MRNSIGLAIVLVSGLVVTPSAADRSVTPFDLREDGSVVVPVTIGGTGSYRFLLDTGSSRTVISSRLWKALRLPVVAGSHHVLQQSLQHACAFDLTGSPRL